MLLLAVMACSGTENMADNASAQLPKPTSPSEPSAVDAQALAGPDPAMSSPLLWYSLRAEYEADNRLDEYERMRDLGGPETEGENCGGVSCNARGRLTIDHEAGCVFLDDELTGAARALAWDSETTSWLETGGGVIIVTDGFEPYASIQDGSRVTVVGTPLELSSPFLTPQQTDLCAPTLWLVNFVVLLDPMPTASDESEPTPTPP